MEVRNPHRSGPHFNPSKSTSEACYRQTQRSSLRNSRQPTTGTMKCWSHQTVEVSRSPVWGGRKLECWVWESRDIQCIPQTQTSTLTAGEEAINCATN